MRNVLFLLCLAALITGCGNNAKKNKVAEESTVTDSISSIEESKAIGNINFFISEKEFAKQKEIFLASCHNPKSDEEYSAALPYILGGYEFVRMDQAFSNDSLMYISLIGLVYSTNYATDLAVRHDAVLSLLKGKYGEPTLNAGMPTERQLYGNQSFPCCNWKLGNKQIIVEAKYESNLYFVNLTSVRMDMVDKINKQKERQLNEATKTDIEKI